MGRETKILFRQDTAANWSTVNPTLDIGEIGYVTSGSDTWGVAKTFKIGDGGSTWKTLTSYFSPGAAIASGKTLTVNNTVTFSGTDASSIAFGTGGTVAYLGTSQTFTGNQIIATSSGTPLIVRKASSGTSDIFQITNSSGNYVYANMDYSGVTTFATQVNSTVMSSNYFKVQSNTHSNWTNITPYFTIPSDSADYTSSTGAVGIEFTTSAGSGVVRYPVVFSNDYSSSVIGYIKTQNNTVSLLGSSDYRLKENVTRLENASLTILSLNPVTFNWIGTSASVDGFIAHELQSVIPEAVDGEKDAVDNNGKPKYQMIDQTKIIPYLVSALQDALKRIEILEGK